MEAAPSDLGRFAREIALADGARLALRPIRADDERRLVALYDRLSHHTAYQRFFTILRRLPLDWARFLANVDYPRRFALVVEHPVGGDDLIGVARWEPADDPVTAEVAFVVQDGWQRRGLGRILLAELLGAARTGGLTRFRAWVLADNRRMLDLLARNTRILSRRLEGGVCDLLFEPVD
jgi:RimJ/RimL family protein N-acetyltransferase